MKLPMPPPDPDQLMAQVLQAKRLPEILGRAIPATSAYLPWDKMRFKTPPDGLSLEEWWLVTRMERRWSQRSIEGLRAKDDSPFSYTLPDEVLRAVDQINRDASGQIVISEQVTSPGTRDRYLVSSLIEEAIRSSQLEGASTTRRDAKEMLRTGRSPRDNSERMIVNNYRAMQQVIDLKNEQLTPALVLELHRIVTDGTLEDPSQAGRLQNDDACRVRVYGRDQQLLHQPPPVVELPGRLEALCDYANGQGKEYIPPVLRAITLHFVAGYDHYFVDGNGRTARALFYWSMLAEGYWLTEFLAISRILRAAPSKYARSFLDTEQDEGDLTHFFIYHLGVIQRAIRDLHAYLARKADDLRQAEAEIRALPGEFNHRQLAVVRSAVSEPDQFITAKSHAHSHRVSGQTARQDLIGLESEGYLERHKVGKAFVWRPASDLASRLHTS